MLQMATTIALSAKLLQHYCAHGGRFNDSSQRLASPTTIKVSLHDQSQSNTNS